MDGENMRDLIAAVAHCALIALLCWPATPSRQDALRGPETDGAVEIRLVHGSSGAAAVR